MRQLLFVLGLSALFFFSGDVRADDLEKPPEPTIVTKKIWYGWQPLTCDAIAGTFFVATALTANHQESPSSPLPYDLAGIGAGTYLVCGPIVHAAHGHGKRAVADFAMRLFMPTFSVAVGIGIDSSSHDDLNLATYLGLFIAAWTAAAAVAIDATIMSRDEKHVVVEQHASRSFFVAPDFSVRKSGGTLGLKGTF